MTRRRLKSIALFLLPGLIDANGNAHWAADASASSWYGQAYPAPASSTVLPESLLPSWSGLSPPPLSDEPLSSPLYEQRGIDARGWPFLALWAPFDPQRLIARSSASLVNTLNSGFPTAPVLPWRPIWSGLLLDTLLYAAALWLLWAILTKPRRFFIEVSRVRRGCCIACGYDLGYDFPRGCPECGWRRQNPVM